MINGIADRENHNDGFYRAFEDRFRGSRDLIRRRLKTYLPLIVPLLRLNQPARALDLGCGRGEWLELLREEGFEAQGVDRDKNMLEPCRELGLNVHCTDALEFLQSLPDGRLQIVSAFHMAEHLHFDQLRLLAAESLRVLSPAGVLILETPNPENILVGCSSFYLDPTHQRPLPPDLLSFVVEWTGFSRVKVLRLNEGSEAARKDKPKIVDVLSAVSPDYAVIGQKAGDAASMALIDPAYGVEIGLTLDALAEGFERRLEAEVWQRAHITELKEQVEAAIRQMDGSSTDVDVRVAATEAAAAAQQAHITELKEQVEAAIRQMDASSTDVDARVANAEAAARQAQAAAHSARLQYQAVIHSTSWRMTKPLRLAMTGARWFGRGSAAWLTLAPGSRPRRALSHFIRAVDDHFAHTSSAQPPSARLVDTGQEHVQQHVCDRMNMLSPRARQIYRQLQVAINRNRKGSV